MVSVGASGSKLRTRPVKAVLFWMEGLVKNVTSCVFRGAIVLILWSKDLARSYLEMLEGT